MGNPIDCRIDIDKEIDLKQRKHVEVLTNHLKRLTDDKLLNFKFIFLEFEYYYALSNEDPCSVPAEVAVEVFTLKNGFDPEFSYTTLLPNKDECLGLLGEVKIHTDITNKIDFQMVDNFPEKKTWRKLYKKLFQMISKKETTDKFKDIAIFSTDVKFAVESLRQLARNADYLHHFEVIQHAITDWTVAVQSLLSICRYKQPGINVLASRVLNKHLHSNDSFDQMSNMRCFYHESDDTKGCEAKYCAKEKAKKLGFNLWALTKYYLNFYIEDWEDLNFENDSQDISIAGKHYPTAENLVVHNLDAEAVARFWESDEDNSDEDEVTMKYRLGLNKAESRKKDVKNLKNQIQHEETLRERYARNSIYRPRVR